LRPHAGCPQHGKGIIAFPFYSIRRSAPKRGCGMRVRVMRHLMPATHDLGNQTGPSGDAFAHDKKRRPRMMLVE